MRRILNLNAVGGRFLLAIALLLGALPALLWLCSLFLRAVHLNTASIPYLIRLSLISGGLLLAAFLILTALEQVQDAYLHRVYLRGRAKRIRLSSGESECPYCGNRQLQEFEKRCPVCGKDLG